MAKDKSHAAKQSKGAARTSQRVSTAASQAAPTVCDRTTSTRLPRTVPKIDEAPLTRLLLKEAMRKGDSLAEMAVKLGVTYGYIAQLRAGLRKPEHIGQSFAESCARYLDIPPVLVKLTSGRISITDFVWPTRSHRRDVAEGVASLRDDPAVGCFVPDALLDADPDVQEFVWLLYQECTGSTSKGIRTIPTALEYLQRAAMNEAEFELRWQELRQDMRA